jgi:hypothetical protein
LSPSLLEEVGSQPIELVLLGTHAARRLKDQIVEPAHAPVQMQDPSDELLTGALVTCAPEPYRD